MHGCPGIKQIVGVVQYINKEDGSSFTESDVATVADMIAKLGPIIETCQMMTKICTTSGLNLSTWLVEAPIRLVQRGTAQGRCQHQQVTHDARTMSRCCLAVRRARSVPQLKVDALAVDFAWGNAKTAIMCAFSPPEPCRGDFHNAVASRAKTIVNQAKQNTRSEGAALSKAYEDEIQKLKKN